MMMNKDLNKIYPYVATRNVLSYKPSVDLVNRIKVAYRMSYEFIVGGGVGGGSVLWDYIIPQKKKDIHEALLKDDESALSLLSSPDQNDLFYGVDNLSNSILNNTPEFSVEYGQELYDQIERLSELLGNKRLFNPMGGSMFPHKNKENSKSLDACLKGIEDALEIPLNFHAPFKNQFGLEAGRYGFITDRSIFALYQSYRLKRLSEIFGLSNCVEIGPGMGRTALYAYRMGLKYAVVDLPITLVGTALFLAAIVGEENIKMHGEVYDNQTIALMTPSDFYGANKNYDIVFNCDSLTEMSKDVAERYIKNFKKNSKFIFSINHEANDFTVMSLCKQLRIQNIQRSNYYFWKGYAEELYVNNENLYL